MCLTRNLSASCTQGALSAGVKDFHFLPISTITKRPLMKTLYDIDINMEIGFLHSVSTTIT